VKSGEQLSPPVGVMYLPVRNAVAAALLNVLDVWMPSQLRCAGGSGHGVAGNDVVRFTNFPSNNPA
jgi:hypothetical protein